MIEAAARMQQVSAIRRRLALAAMAALGILVALLVASTFVASAQRRAADQLHVHTLEVLLASGRLETAINYTLRGERGYLLTGDTTFLAPYTDGRAQVGTLTRQLRQLTRDNPVQQRTMTVIERRLARYLTEIERLVALEASGRHDEAIRLVKTGIGRRQINSLLDAVHAFEDEEYRLLELRSGLERRSEARNDVLLYVLAAVGTLLLALLSLAVMSAARAHRRAVDLAAELQVQATTDALTGLPNRRHVIESLETELLRAKRAGRPLALALLDIDRFKQVNDTHGHPAGDEVLRVIADEIKRASRGGDIVGRFGGEEFAILMPETSREQAEIACERMRLAVSRRTIEYPNGTVGRVTVSTGVAVWSPEEASPQFVARADVALYQAKQDGRNLVRLAA